MFKNKSAKWKVLIPSFLILFLTSCKQVRDASGNIIEENVIRLGDSWSYEGIFESFIVWPLSQLINFFSQYAGVVGAIIIITVLVRLATFRQTLQSQIMSQKMQMIQPKLNAIQEKYKGRDDQQSRMQMFTEQQNLQKKHGIQMSKMFLPTLLQLPVIMALWSSVNRSEAVLNGEFLGNSLFTSPQQGMAEGNLFYFVIFGLVVLVNAGAVLLPQYLAKKKAKRYPNQRQTPQQGKGMMYFMVGLMAYIGLTLSSAMSIYLIISNGIQIAQTLYTNSYMSKTGALDI